MARFIALLVVLFGSEVHIFISNGSRHDQSAVLDALPLAQQVGWLQSI